MMLVLGLSKVLLAREVQQFKARGRGEVLEKMDVLLGIGGR